ncbi:hypothetical protein [Metabacillus sp. Hm71]|uniref:hypothetical protein n=1 Tax=Metabacillus sp. Hm71 TaxID=3450743 RepID=UPI003F41F26E
MKQIKLEIHNHIGEVVSEDILTVGEGDKVILQVPEGSTLEYQSRLHKAFKNTLISEDKNVISMPDNVKIKILKVN